MYIKSLDDDGVLLLFHCHHVSSILITGNLLIMGGFSDQFMQQIGHWLLGS